MLDNPISEDRHSDYPTLDSHLSFADYINLCRTIIKARRMDLQQNNANLIIDANSPYEFTPPQPIYSGQKPKYGVLLVHGLLDCPFSLKDIATHLQAQGIVCRSVLLPGHGTRPDDLLSVNYQEWLSTLQYGIESFANEVENLYLIGYSTGAALALHQALTDTRFSGLILIAPAIRIKISINLIVTWHYLKRWLHINHNQWIDKIPEVDYAKYLSIPFNAVNQVSALTNKVRELHKSHTLNCPIFMIVSREDRTISTAKAMEFFSGFDHPDSKLLLYTAIEKNYKDKRIINRMTANPELNIRHFSHSSLPFKPDNPHYGKNGDYEYASHSGEFIDGAYSRSDIRLLNKLNKYKIIHHHYRQLTYNPDFDYMADEITKFIISK